MNSSLQITCLAGTLALLADSASGKAGRVIDPEQTLVIRIYDKAQVPAAAIHLATMETARLFRAAGIRISWEHLSAESPEDKGTDMSAVAFRQPDKRPYLVIRLMRQTPATVFREALGYSLPFAHRGAHVLIFYDRVEALAQRVNAAIYVILGHAMAHELGHVLLGSSEHTSGGLMQARWTPTSWRLASAGLVVFDRAEITRIRTGLSKFQVVVEGLPPHEPVPASFGLPRSLQ
jgi:hypothetical protein